MNTTVPWLLGASGAFVIAAACSEVSLNLANLPCDAAGECAVGYTCELSTYRCVSEFNNNKIEGPTTPSGDDHRDCNPAIEDCGHPATGEPCTPVGTTLSCGAVAEGCEQGCRTCMPGGAWSDCEKPGCILGSATSCSDCDDNCMKYARVEDAVCSLEGRAATCVVMACEVGFADADGDSTNGCEASCEPTADKKELCEGKDNDCDGVIDNGFALHVGCGIGQCAGGMTECNASGDDTQCSTMPGGSRDASSPELCDEFDHDCDGDPKNGFLVGAACGKGACSGGVLECNASGDGTQCSTMPGGSANASAPEVCDGVDNNCDGTIDENLGSSCRCAGGGALPLAGENCGDGQGNGIDDDCNGAVDDGCGMLMLSNLGLVEICQSNVAVSFPEGTVSIDTDSGNLPGHPGLTTQLVAQSAGYPDIRVFYAGSINIPKKTTVKVTGGAALALVACTDVTIAGVLRVDGSGQSAGPGGGAGGSHGSSGQGFEGGAGAAGEGVPTASRNKAGGGGGGNCGDGGDGGDAGDQGGGDGGNKNGNKSLQPLFGGSGGGPGPSWAHGHPGKYGGGGGGAIQISAGERISVSGTLTASGAGGGNSDCDGCGGGGGGGGGSILLEAIEVSISGTVAANGGGGGGGDDYEGETPRDTTGDDGRPTARRAEGGRGADGATGSGGDGGDGGALADDKIHGAEGRTPSGSKSIDSGGGGGGAGRIRVNTDGAERHQADRATISPDDPNCYVRGDISYGR